MNVQVTTNLADLSQVAEDYAVLRGMASQDVVQTQGGKLMRETYFQMRDIRPPKGKPRADAMAVLARRGKLKIRQTVVTAVMAKRAGIAAGLQGRGFRPARQGFKFLTPYQEMARMEMGRREMGRGFLAISSKYPAVIRQDTEARSRYKPRLSTAKLESTPTRDAMTVNWSGDVTVLAKSASEGIDKPKAQGAILRAIDNTKQDILAYAVKKQMAAVAKALAKLTKGGTP